MHGHDLKEKKKETLFFLNWVREFVNSQSVEQAITDNESKKKKETLAGNIFLAIYLKLP